MVDLYCERVGPGLSAEPLNALSNVAFFVAAWAAWRLAGRLAARSPGTAVLLALVVSVGIGSSLFHTFATPWARALDIGTIVLFQVAYLWRYGRRVARLGAPRLVMLLVVFVLGVHAGRQFPDVLNRSLTYGSAVVAILALAVYHTRAGKAGRDAVLAAAAVFLVAVGFRTIDNTVCGAFPLGTHFLWHLLIPLALYLLMRGLLLNNARALRRRAAFGSSIDFLASVRDLIARLEATGHGAAAVELRQGLSGLDGLTDGAAQFRSSVEKVQRECARLAPEDQDALERIRNASRRAVYRPRG